MSAGKYLLTVGHARDGREMAVITTGGHPQIDTLPCTVCAVVLVSELPDRDAQRWFARMIEERPWETRQ